MNISSSKVLPALINTGATRSALNRRAVEIRELLGADWRFMVSMQAGGRSARVVFFSGRQRIIISQDGSVCGYSTNIPGLRAKMAAAIRGLAKSIA